MSTNATPSTRASNGRGILISVLLVLIILLVVVRAKYFPPDACENLDGMQEKVPSGYHLVETGEERRCVADAVAHPPAPTPSLAVEDPIYGVTPATVNPDSGQWANLEIDGPVMLQYPGEKAFLVTPGGCKQLPQPRQGGPKKLWDPKDPENGHIGFRIYKVPRSCKQ